VGHLRWISVDEESLTLLLVEEVVVGVLEEARAGRWTVLILEDRGWLLLAFVVLAAAVVAIGWVLVALRDEAGRLLYLFLLVLVVVAARARIMRWTCSS